MKHVADTQTQEHPGLPVAPKKRGRPVTGKAMTAAERKSQQRRRDINAYAYHDWSSMTTTGLLERLSRFLKEDSVTPLFHDLSVFDEVTAELRLRLASRDSHE